MTGASRHVARLRAGAERVRRSALMRSGAGLSCVTACEMAFAILASILLARQLGLEGLGIYAIVLASVNFAGLPAHAGLMAFVMREIARAEAEAGSDTVKGVIIFAATIILVASVTVVPVVLILSFSLAYGLGDSALSILPVAALLIPVHAFCKMLGATLAGRHRVVLGALPFRLVRPVGFAIALGVVSVVQPDWLTPMRAIVLQLLVGLVALCVAAVLFLVHFHETLRQRRRTIHWKAWLATIVRLGVSNGMMQAQPELLLLLTGALGSVEAVGLFRIALRGAEVVMAGSVVAQTVAAPKFAQFLAEGAHDRLQRLVTGVARVAFAVSLLGLSGFLVIGHWLLAILFGPEFVPAWSALIVLTAAEVVSTVLGPGGMLMNMARREVVTLSGQALSLVLSLAAAALLVPLLGVLGTAGARTTGTIAAGAFLRLRTRRELGVDPSAIARAVPFG